MGREMIGIDIGGTYFRIGRVLADGTVENFCKLPVRHVFHGDDPLRNLVDYLRSYFEGMPPEGIAIGFPATLDAKRQRVLQAPNLPFMEDLPVADILTEYFGVPVCLERDVTMTMFQDCRELSLPEKGMICGFYFGTGIGNAIFINGQLLIGRNGTAGELGHIPADGSRLICGCGNVGCMENLAGGKYLSHLCQTMYPDTKIQDLFLAHGADALLRQFVDRMAITVATEINILDPDFVLLGGGVPSMAAFPRREFLEQILAHTRKPLPASTLDIRFTEDREDKSVLGAAAYGRKWIREHNL